VKVAMLFCQMGVSIVSLLPMYFMLLLNVAFTVFCELLYVVLEYVSYSW